MGGVSLLHANRVVDAPHPHVGAGTSSRLAAFRPEEAVSFIQLLPCYLSSPSVPVPFFSC